MRSFEYEGVKYRSVAAACRALGLSYTGITDKLRRYKRARDKPSLAFDWLRGRAPFDAKREPLTMQGVREQELHRLSQRIYCLNAAKKRLKRGRA